MSDNRPPSSLTLRPASESDTSAIREILDEPRLARRHLSGGIAELHPVEWTLKRRTFGVRLNGELFGSVDLKQDEDESTQWELSVVLNDHKRSLDGARSAIAGVFYAFQILKAQAVSFWAPTDNQLIQTFAEQIGFSQLNTLKAPGGHSVRVFELTRAGWRTAQDGRLALFLADSVDVYVGGGVWRGQGKGFSEL
jgi:hypothetical protein